MGFVQDINEVFNKWFNGEHLREDEVEFITYNSSINHCLRYTCGKDSISLQMGKTHQVVLRRHLPLVWMGYRFL